MNTVFTQGYLHVKSLDIESLDIKLLAIVRYRRSTSRGSTSSKGVAEGRAERMDAVTSFELEAQRRRETVVSDRDQAWARASSSTARVETTAIHRIVGQVAPAGPRSNESNCEPAPLTRQAVS
jgi:hypothetical protein